jgi:hypothetical protein
MDHNHGVKLATEDHREASRTGTLMAARRSLLTFLEPDGRVSVEILGCADDVADLVDPNDGSVIHSEPFAMHGGEWRISGVTVTEDLIRVECVSTAAQVPVHPPVSSSRSSIHR